MQYIDDNILRLAPIVLSPACRKMLFKNIYEIFESDKTPEEFIDQFPVYPLHRSILSIW